MIPNPKLAACAMNLSCWATDQPAPAAIVPTDPAPQLPPRSISDMTSARHKAAPTAIVLAVIVAVIVGLSAWYLSRPVPLIDSGRGRQHADRHRRAGRRPDRQDPGRAGQNVPGRRDPAPDRQSRADRQARRSRGRRRAWPTPNSPASRPGRGRRPSPCARPRSTAPAADVTLAQQTYDRTRKLVAGQYATQRKLDEATAALAVAQRSTRPGQARL